MKASPENHMPLLTGKENGKNKKIKREKKKKRNCTSANVLREQYELSDVLYGKGDLLENVCVTTLYEDTFVIPSSKFFTFFVK